MSFRSCLLVGTASLGVAISQNASAGPLVVGSGNEAVIEPLVSHPAETPCIVPLATQAKFGADPVAISYTPPVACPGPWAKVVLHIRLSLNEGRQFDRSGALFLAGVPLWFGTTAEPRATLAPSWSFERDVTDDTALFTTAQAGVLQVPNYQSSVYTSTITANVSLAFYPATATYPAPVTADIVLPIPTSGGLSTLNTSSDQAAFSGNLPTNIQRAIMDIYLQGQSADEFWYTCVPSSFSQQLLGCGNTAFREGEITVDGAPAGIAPVFPWIFTGGIDPYLWQPIPGVQTFSFTPFAVDLSPFAGALSNGAAHTIAASVFNANGYFSATGALRLFLDKKATTVNGGIVKNTLVAPNPKITPNISTSNGVSTGSIDIASTRSFVISGTVVGSAGTTINTVVQTTHFGSHQVFNVSAARETQNTFQNTDTTVASSSRNAGGTTNSTTSFHYPLTLYYSFLTLPNSQSIQTTKVDQQYQFDALGEAQGVPVSQLNIDDGISTADTLFFDSNFSVTGHKSQSETAEYTRSGTSTPCFKRKLVATSNVLTAVQTGC